MSAPSGGGVGGLEGGSLPESLLEFSSYPSSSCSFIAALSTDKFSIQNMNEQNVVQGHECQIGQSYSFLIVYFTILKENMFILIYSSYTFIP